MYTVLEYKWSRLCDGYGLMLVEGVQEYVNYVNMRGTRSKLFRFVKGNMV